MRKQFSVEGRDEKMCGPLCVFHGSTVNKVLHCFLWGEWIHHSQRSDNCYTTLPNFPLCYILSLVSQCFPQFSFTGRKKYKTSKSGFKTFLAVSCYKRSFNPEEKESFQICEEGRALQTCKIFCIKKINYVSLCWVEIE